jgi:uncharacterized damage-inducible protein DinB
VVPGDAPVSWAFKLWTVGEIRDTGTQPQSVAKRHAWHAVTRKWIWMGVFMLTALSLIPKGFELNVDAQLSHYSMQSDNSIIRWPKQLQRACFVVFSRPPQV